MAKRTTVTLDDDVAARLAEEARNRDQSLRQALNDALRRGLNPPARNPGGKRFRIRGPFARGRPGISFDNVEDLLDQIEGPSRR